MNQSLEPLYTSDFAATVLGVKKCTVRNECYRRKLGFVTVGRQIRHTRQHLLDYLRDQEVSACATSPSETETSQIKFVAPALPDAIDRKAQIARLARDTFAPKPHRARGMKKKEAA